MLIDSIILENFRGYHARQVIKLSDLTAFVGKNDVGKSTILEALDIFFNEGKGVIKLDAQDINKDAITAADGVLVDIVIGVTFKDIPGNVVLDENNSTTLADEYLLDENQKLTVIKKHPNAAGKAKVFIYANHPQHELCKDLLSKKQSELRRLTEGLECDRNKNASMRAAIRQQHIDELNLGMQEIDVTKEDAKNIWEKLKNYMPVYSLFQADRSNGDKDKEVQDPLKEAVRHIFNQDDIKTKCTEIYQAVMAELQEVSNRTLEKIHDMNPELANTLHPTMPSSDILGWADVFKSVSITGDNDIPINKRGSGVKRMVLLNFFRAEAERVQQAANSPGIIYAIEEPETAQHIVHQQMLVDSLLTLSRNANTQVIITTHSSNIVKRLSFDNIRLIIDIANGRQVNNIDTSQLPYPSLNEISFTSFGEITEEYHDELYSHIEYKGWMGQYKQGKPQIPYNQLRQDGTTIVKQYTQTEIIRHQIHHPENIHNVRYTIAELQQSINDMRRFIQAQNVVTP